MQGIFRVPFRQLIIPDFGPKRQHMPASGSAPWGQCEDSMRNMILKPCRRQRLVSGWLYSPTSSTILPGVRHLLAAELRRSGRLVLQASPAKTT